MHGGSPYVYNDGFGFEGDSVRGAASEAGAKEPDMQAVDRKKDGTGSCAGGHSRRAPERDLFGQSSLERLEEENSSLRAITKYLIHERKELRKKADTASKRNQNLNNLLQVSFFSSFFLGGGGALVNST